MKDTDRIEKLLEDAPSPRIADGPHRVALKRQLVARLKESRRAARLPRWLMPAAAAACVAVAAVMLVVNGTTSVYAQAVEALRRAKTVHARAFRIVDGKEKLGAEIWYDAKLGVRERTIARDGSVPGEMLDNGEFRWTYRSAKKTVIKDASRDPVGHIAEILEFDRKLAKWSFKRTPAADMTIDGVSCLAYESKAEKQNVAQRVWIDPQNRVRRWEEVWWKDGKEVVDERCKIAYDQPLPKGRFDPTFGVGVKVVDLTKATPMALEKSLIRKEVLGQVLTVHKVLRLDNGSLMLVWSHRPTKETLRRYGLSHVSVRGNILGDAHVGTGWKRLEDGTERSIQPINIAYWQGDGRTTTWTILIPWGNWPSPMKTVELQFRVYARGTLQEELKKQGKPWHNTRFDLGRLDLPDQSVTMEATCREVYQHAAWVHSRFGSKSIRLTGVNRSLTEQEKQEEMRRYGTPRERLDRMSRTPFHEVSRITPEQFVENVQANYEKLR
ncbi:MAG: hypothetical protein AMS16_05865 [Planctomycetes bacterium DG_58]|nr:MAG: hypothetical protein AMS16_05865 [Planctomycetes bacterium DG_58]